MATALASVAELRQHMGIGDSYDDAQLTRALDAAAAWIESDEGCGRVFALDEEDVTKVYAPSRAGVVAVVDLVSVTSIKLDTAGNRTYSTTLQPSDYVLWPFNEPRYSEIRSWGTAGWRFSPGTPVQVVGRFGYVEDGGVPKPVKEACLLLAARWFKRAEVPFGSVPVAVPEIGSLGKIAARDVDAALLLQPYKRSAGWVIA